MKKYLPLLLAASGLVACVTTKTAQKSDAIPVIPVAAKNAPAPIAAPAAPAASVTNVSEASVRGENFAERTDLKSVPFDFDSANLSDEARTALKANAEILKSEPALEVLVSGDCDQRGTTAYNLALGQKRAKEVRDYYVELGVEGGRIATISYGKEKPLCSEMNEPCWSKNRRAETLARQKSVANTPAH